MLHVRTVRRSAAGVASEQTYFAYDALGRRIAKRNSGNVTRFVWDGMRLLQERRKGLAGTYVYEENVQEETYAPLARLDTPAPVGTAFGKPTLTENTPSAQFYYFHINASGQPEELTDADGKVVWQARYTTWGRVLEERSAPGIEQNLRFQGQYFDQETGLCYNTFRYYDPDLGRFITEDPIGLDGGINLYQYGPNPLMWIDPWGWAGNPATATHITYQAIDIQTGKPYIGYASKQGHHTGQEVLKYRYSGDYSRFGGQEPTVVYEGYGQKGKDTARGLEQRRFENLGGFQGTANQQNPVGEGNKRRTQYLKAADEHINKSKKLSHC